MEDFPGKYEEGFENFPVILILMKIIDLWD